MLLKILAAAAALALFCSCGALGLSGTESLLFAPNLNQQQEAVTRAFKSSIPTRSIVYKPPQSGEYRSPFVFYDIDGDELDEAIVFYAFSGTGSDSASARAAVLKQTANDKWTLFYDAASPTQGTEIEFVEFEKLLSTQSSCVIIGWKTAAMNKPSTLAIYSIKDNSFFPEAATDYLSYSIEDFDRNGLGEIAIVGHDNTRGRFRLSLWRNHSGRFAEVDGIELSPEVGTPVSMTTGNLWDGFRGIYIDELLSGNVTTFATEILRVNAAGLTLLSGGAPVSRDDPAGLARSNYESTFRDEDMLCRDFDGDGTVSVPCPVDLPGPVELSDSETPRLMQLMKLTSDGFETGQSAVINAKAGYLVYFPEKWLGEVTLEVEDEDGEWRFKKWNDDAHGAAEELLRIRTAQAVSGPDVFGDYTELARKGTVVYSAYIPALQDERLSVTGQDVLDMFKLL